jgi:hypothetical protein
MQTIAVIALILGIALLLRGLGPPVRRKSEEMKTTPQNPEADIPPPTTPIL